VLKKFEGVFSDEQVSSLKDIISNEKQNRDIFVWNEDLNNVFPKEESITKIIQNLKLGKISISLNDLITEDIRNTLEDLSQKNGFPAILHNATYTEYSLRYGIPELESHKDKLKNFWLVDYQLESNTNWEIYVEDQSFYLGDNDALAFYPHLLEHGRPEKAFKDGEYLGMIFFSMIAKNITEEKGLLK
jgi:hypothetical protein